jgi:hypothetical protein
VHAVHADTVDALKPTQRLPSFACEARISPEIGNCTAGFDPTKNILLGQILMLNRNRRLAINAGAPKMLKHDGRQP